MHQTPSVAHGFNHQSLYRQPVANLRQINEIVWNRSNEAQQMGVFMSPSISNQQFVSADNSSREQSRNTRATQNINQNSTLSRQSSLGAMPTTRNFTSQASGPLSNSRSVGNMNGHIQRERRAHTMAPLTRILGPIATPKANMFASIIAPSDTRATKSSYVRPEIPNPAVNRYPQPAVEMPDVTDDNHDDDDDDDDAPIIVKVRYDPDAGFLPSEEAIRAAVDDQLRGTSGQKANKDPIILNYFNRTIQPQIPRMSIRPPPQQQQQLVNRPALSFSQPANRPFFRVPGSPQQQSLQLLQREQQQQQLMQQQQRLQREQQQQRLQREQQQQQQLMQQQQRLQQHQQQQQQQHQQQKQLEQQQQLFEQQQQQHQQKLKQQQQKKQLEQQIQQQQLFEQQQQQQKQLEQQLQQQQLLEQQQQQQQRQQQLKQQQLLEQQQQQQLEQQRQQQQLLEQERKQLEKQFKQQQFLQQQQLKQRQQQQEARQKQQQMLLEQQKKQLQLQHFLQQQEQQKQQQRYQQYLFQQQQKQQQLQQQQKQQQLQQQQEQRYQQQTESVELQQSYLQQKQQYSSLPPIAPRSSRIAHPGRPSFIHQPPVMFPSNNYIRALQHFPLAPVPLRNSQQFQTISIQQLPNRNIRSALASPLPTGLDLYKSQSHKYTPSFFIPINFGVSTEEQSSPINNSDTFIVPQSLLRRPHTAPASTEMFRPPSALDIPELSKENLSTMLNEIPDLHGRQFNIEYAPVTEPNGYPIPLALGYAANEFPEAVVVDKLPKDIIEHVRNSNNPALEAALNTNVTSGKNLKLSRQPKPPLPILTVKSSGVLRHGARPRQQVQQSLPGSSDDPDSSIDKSSSEKETDIEESEISTSSMV